MHLIYAIYVMQQYNKYDFLSGKPLVTSIFYRRLFLTWTNQDRLQKSTILTDDPSIISKNDLDRT